MNGAELNLNTARAKKARLAVRIGKTGLQILVILAVILTVAAVTLFITHNEKLGYLSLALALICAELALWYKRDLTNLTANKKDLTSRLAGDILGRLDPKQTPNSANIWEAINNQWQVIFMTNHLLIEPDSVKKALLADNLDIANVWQESARLADSANSGTIEERHVAGALLILSTNLKPLLEQINIQKPDIEAIVSWLDRAISTEHAKPYFGGVGRDWANGYTPQLNRYGQNISLEIEASGSFFTWLTTSPGVTSMKNAFSEGANAIAIIGDDGIGKTSHVYALAQRLLAEKNDRNLEHRQIIGLNPSTILANVSGSGELERVVLRLVSEASRAGHIILFLDDAQLFFNSGPGSFDITQILMPVLESRAIQVILALNTHDYQQLRSSHAAFANLLTPVVLAEPDQVSTMKTLEDTTLNLEAKHHLVISYAAIREAYRLSGRYEQNLAYPGKAIQLLTESLAHATENVVDEHSVQQTIEQTKGVKASVATPVEASDLLNLEDKIHERMINQTYAVKVVSNALRRARAGVSDPKRPSGSFLFLGPTGVGKTELARSLAATYFGSETNMIRLDMSEYQEAGSIDRLLSDGQKETNSLILAVREQPSSVVLLDEIEKAHPSILNLLLQLLDEGQLTDSGGKPASFKDCIIIATSNAGAQTIRKEVENGQEPENFQPILVEELINSGQFKPELINRFDEIVVFRPLKPDELAQVVDVMMKSVNQTLANQNISVKLTPAATQKIVATGYDPRLGARPMRRVLERAVEDTVAQKILKGEIKSGNSLTLDVNDLLLEL